MVSRYLQSSVLTNSSPEFGLAQIWPIVDEDAGAEAKVVNVGFATPYVLIVKDDSTILLLKADKKGELDEMDLPLKVANGRFLSASIYDDYLCALSPRRKSTAKQSEHVLALLDQVGSLILYSLLDLNHAFFHHEGMHFLPQSLAQDVPIPKHWKTTETLTEVLVADLGDNVDKSPFLIVRTSSDDIVLYRPYLDPGPSRSLLFQKQSSKRIAKAPEEAALESIEADTRQRNNPLRSTNSLGGLSAVFVPGASPAVIAKTASSSPKVHNLSIQGVKAISAFDHPICPEGFVYIDDKDFLHMAQLPAHSILGQSEWIARKVNIGETVVSLTYFAPTGSYILATSRPQEFHLPQDDEWHSEWKDEATRFPPQLEQGAIRLFSPRTSTIIGSFPLEPSERAICVKALNLEVSEETHERKDLIAVGTAVVKGENMTARGNIYLFDVVDVVPEPGVPETDRKLKLVAKEEVKGAVTSISPVGSQGFLLAAQGQKCMVRGLKEDLSILPVAFMDMKYYVKVAKELRGTGLCILGDAMQGLWLVGYSVSDCAVGKMMRGLVC